MSYLAGIGPGFDVPPRDPQVLCDGCGATRNVLGNGGPPSWFLARKPPPGWRGLRKHDGSKRWDLCPACWKDPEP